MPEITNEAFITDEKTGKTWFKTGDIGTILKDGTIRIIDRKKDIVKLKHGEYVSLVQIEQSIIQNILVDMVCVLPNVNSDYLVALIVPNREETKNLCIASKKKHETMDAEELIRNQLVQELIQLDIIIKLEESGKLNKYELPHKICIVSDIWTPESGFFTKLYEIYKYIYISGKISISPFSFLHYYDLIWTHCVFTKKFLHFIFLALAYITTIK
ncbi:hypothetical protein HZS_5498 [Henneguya salminicola]|nr:hypothetical protein HZS_5498 [Henneguya salminicola]